MKALILNYNRDYFSPMNNSWIYMFKLGMDIDFFGPGYVDRALLNQGLKSFMKDWQYDFIVIPTIWIQFVHVQKTRGDTAAINEFFRNSITNFDLADCLRIENILQEVVDTKCVKILWDFSDTYALQSDLIEKFEKWVDRDDTYLIATGEQFSKKLSECKKVELEKHYVYATDEWYYFTRKYAHKVISIGHFVHESTFCFSDLCSRKFSWCVLGANYYSRKKALQTLKTKGIGVRRNAKMRILMKVMQGLGLRPYQKKYMVHWLQSSFNDVLQNSRFSYTCGGRNESVVLKYFEIPAAGCVLVCYPFCGMEHMGFKHMENCIITEPDDLQRVHQWLITHEEEAQSMALKCQNLVWEKHSLHARTQQLGRALDAIINNQFWGTRWEDGEFIVQTKVNRCLNEGEIRHGRS